MSHQPVVVTDVQIPFGRMVMLILQVMLASIPAIILFYLIMGLCFLLFSGLFAGLFAATQTMQ
jgi:hypothetical protein